MSTFQGQEYQHALIDVQLNLPGVAPIKSVTFSALAGKVGAEKEAVYDSQGNIIAYVIKNKKIDASTSMLLSEWRRIRSQMVQIGALLVPQQSVLQIAMDWTITYGNSILNYRTDTWRGVMVQEDPLDSKNDQNVLEAALPLFVQEIQPDGQPSIIYRPY